MSIKSSRPNFLLPSQGLGTLSPKPSFLFFLILIMVYIEARVVKFLILSLSY